MRILESIILILVFTTTSFSAIVKIPLDQPTIQAGVDVANDWDTVLVNDGIYYENVKLKSYITIASNYIIDSNYLHINETIVNGSGLDYVFSPPFNEWASNVEINGLTIENGDGGVYVSTQLYLYNSIIINNFNSATNWSGVGGVFLNENGGGDSRIINNTIIGNSGLYCGGIMVACTSDVHIFNNIVAYNEGGGIINQCGMWLWTENNCLFHNTDYDCFEDCNWPDTIADPWFCDTSSGNYFIGTESPCAPENSPNDSLIGALPTNCIGPDPDNDLVYSPNDNCPFVYNPLQDDTNGDGIGDACCCLIRGDVATPTDGFVLVNDLTFLIDYLFKGGETPGGPDHGDCAIPLDGNIFVDDLIYLVNYLFKGGPAPPEC